MKMTIMSLTVLASASAFAASTKVCFYTSGDSYSKGDHFVVTLSKESAKISKGSGDLSSYEGVAKANGKVKGRDGLTYLSYRIDGPEGGEALLVPAKLLASGASGGVKIRWRGEGYSQVNFFCRDDRNK